MRRIILFPMPPKYVRLLRMAVWNALFIIAGLLLIALAGEAYLRLANPFIETSASSQFVDGVGPIRKPHSELRFANWRDDHYLVSRANSLGFLDREPVSLERAAAGCHIAFIGDSFVEAMEAPIADKFHVRLEEMATLELPHLDIATQAYGMGGTAQISQLPFYDEYALRLNPKLVILVFYFNDFSDNLPAGQAINFGADPDRLPFMSAQRDANGALKLRPPNSDYARFLLPSQPKRWRGRAWQRLTRVSYFAKWLDDKNPIGVDDRDVLTEEWTDIIAERPCCQWLQDVRRPGVGFAFIKNSFKEEHLPPALEQALAYTAFGIDQFKRRADRDGVNLAILAAAELMGTRGDPQFDRLTAIAEPRGIPVISWHDYIVKQGYNAGDASYRFNVHWNAAGHQWTAEAVLEWLKANQEVCD